MLNNKEKDILNKIINNLDTAPQSEYLTIPTHTVEWVVRLLKRTNDELITLKKSIERLSVKDDFEIPGDEHAK
jgi:hypothetical protein